MGSRALHRVRVDGLGPHRPRRAGREGRGKEQGVLPFPPKKAPLPHHGSSAVRRIGSWLPGCFCWILKVPRQIAHSRMGMDVNPGKKCDWPIDRLGWILLLRKRGRFQIWEDHAPNRHCICCGAPTVVCSCFFFCHLKPHVTLEVRYRAVL